ncbi:hypothetical protein M569_17303 [Genlisea aurea]|uniref:Uncharacterized protein n=1 Tax=Genlisea aurea TaxID=192259 RepID=S8BSG3_9LAMI|nr:hypothetical protein M569_17303 [Genlisea aurea]
MSNGLFKFKFNGDWGVLTRFGILIATVDLDFRCCPSSVRPARTAERGGNTDSVSLHETTPNSFFDLDPPNKFLHLHFSLFFKHSSSKA